MVAMKGVSCSGLVGGCWGCRVVVMLGVVVGVL